MKLSVAEGKRSLQFWRLHGVLKFFICIHRYLVAAVVTFVVHWIIILQH